MFVSKHTVVSNSSRPDDMIPMLAIWSWSGLFENIGLVLDRGLHCRRGSKERTSYIYLASASFTCSVL